MMHGQKNIKLKTILVDATMFYYKNNICLHKILSILTLQGHHQARINNKKAVKLSMLGIGHVSLYIDQYCYYNYTQ